jgi:hypothetical protein
MPLTNNLDVPLKKIADDLTSYYLLGYYSTNAKLDGRYRRIEVRVKRPGVDVRARRGYRAPTEEEIRNARAAAPAASGPTAAPEVTGAFTDLVRIREDAAFVITAGPRRDAAGRVTAVWIAGEVRRARGVAPPAGAGVLDLSASGGGARGDAQVPLPEGQRAFLAEVPLDKPAEGAIDVRARLSGLGVVPFTDTARVEPARVPQAIVYRRGPATGVRYDPAGTMLFTRTERVRLELPLAPGMSATGARVLDRSGKAMPVPVALSERTDAVNGQRVAVADLSLAPITLGDYAIEITLKTAAAEERSITAIRIGR